MTVFIILNELVIEKAGQHPELNGMGTTFVVAFIMDETLFVANVGDSRLYLVDSGINQVTEDHSFVGAMVRAGELTPDEARLGHPDKNIITRAIGHLGMYVWIFLRLILNLEIENTHVLRWSVQYD